MKSVTWKCPSNIALIKYWGKKGNQLPANPSLSFTLDRCHTVTTVRYHKKENDGILLVSFAYNGQPMPSFEPKLETFLANIESLFPFLPGYQIDINTVNTFPHSSGIASSASGMAALALCLCSMEQAEGLADKETDFFRKASHAARLGSGSACRSVYSPLVLWGETSLYPGSSDQFAIPVHEVHPVFKTFCDTILIVDEGKKEVSSTQGHGLLHAHPFAGVRYQEAGKNLEQLKQCLISGDLELYRNIVEREALMLHALMMTSNPAFILMKPNTLAILQAIMHHRRQSGIMMMFTLDAGANVHLLYPESERNRVQHFINSELVQYCHNGALIHDQVGNGPVQL